MSSKKYKGIKCSNCNGNLDFDENQKTTKCHYCGTKYSVEELLNNDSDDVKIEKIKSQTIKDLEILRAKIFFEKEERVLEKEEIEKFKKGKFSKVLLIFAALCGLFTFTRDFNFGSIIGFVKTVLFLVAWLMGMKIIKEPKKGLHIILAIIAFALIIPYLNFDDSSSSYEEKPTKFGMSDIELKEHFPEPSKLYGRIETNRKNLLIIDICNISEKEYKRYINDKVIKFGYDIDLEYKNWDTVYGAFDKDGYSIRIIYDDIDKEMSITLEAPEEMNELEWPNFGLSTKVPKPKSNYGKIYRDNDESFIVHIGNTSFDEYNEYVKECENKGFIENRSKSEKSYSGTNTDGYEIHLMYIGANVIEISVEPAESNDSSNITSSEDELREEFKNAMDKYESFIDEYVAFMKKYNDSNGVDIDLNDYTNYLNKYSEAMEAFEEWEYEDMNDKETSYYAQVQIRTNKKLQEIAY